MPRSHIINYKGLPINLDTISGDMAIDSLKELKELFFIEGSYSPLVRWCISEQADWPLSHRTLFKFWKKRPACSFSPLKIISEDVLQEVKDTLLIAEYHEDRNDFTYAWIGYQVKMAGTSLKEERSLVQSVEYEGSMISLFNFTALGACVIRQQPLLTLYQQTTSTGMRVWSSLIAPFINEENKVKGLVISTVYS